MQLQNLELEFHKIYIKAGFHINLKAGFQIILGSLKTIAVCLCDHMKIQIDDNRRQSKSVCDRRKIS